MDGQNERQTGWAEEPKTNQTSSELVRVPSPPSAAHDEDENLEDRPAWIDCIERITTVIFCMHQHATTSRESDNLLPRIMKRITTRHDSSSSTRINDRRSLVCMVSSRLENIDLLLQALNDLANHIREVYKTKGLDAANSIVDKLASVPHLVPTIVFLRDEETRDEIFAHPCIRRVIFCVNTTVFSDEFQVGQEKQASVSSGQNDFSRHDPLLHASSVQMSWILQALESKGVSGSQKTSIHHCVVNYLVRVSSLTIIDYTAVFVDREKLENYELGIHLPAPDVAASFEKDCQNLFNFISSFKMLVPLLFSLSHELMEEAALTAVVENAMNELVKRPFMITQVYTDLFWYCILIFVVRNSIYLTQDSFRKTERSTDNSGFLVACFQFPCYVYFVARTIADLLSFGLLSRAYFFQNLFFSWTIVDIVSITVIVVNVFVAKLLSPAAVMQDNAYVIFQTCVLGMAWVKTIGFIHYLHPQLAVLVISSFDMIKVILPFLVVLGIFIFGFGDIMYNAYQPGCQSGKYESVFCQSSQFDSYMAIYRLLVGDLSYEDDFNANRFTSILFFLVTCVGIIFLLNLLIAVISEAYADSVSRSKRLYGRTRVVLLTKSVLLEEQLNGGRVGCTMRFFVRLAYVAVFLPILFLSYSYYFYWRVVTPGASDVTLSFVVACLTSLVVFFQLISKIQCFGRINEMICTCLCTKPLRWVLLRIMGHSGEKQGTVSVVQDDSETRIKVAVRKETLLLRECIESQHKEIAQLKASFETERNVTKKQLREALKAHQNILCKALVDEIRSVVLTENSRNDWVPQKGRRQV